MRTAKISVAGALAVLLLAGCGKLTSMAFGGADAAASAGSAAATTPTSAPAATAASGSAPVISGFAGDVEMKITAPSIPQGMDISYEVKGDKIRFDLASFAPGMPAMWGLEDRTANKLYMVLDAQKMIMVTDLGAAAKARAAQAPKYTIEKTGKLDTVAGQSCEIWNLTGEGKKVELCVVKGMQALPTGNFASTPGADLGWSAGLESEGVMPLRVVVTQNGAQTMRMDVVKMDKKVPDDARFVLPAGYRQINQGAIPGMPGMPGARQL
jgi:hypothetical protein